MTLIFSKGNIFWIESFHITRAAIADQAERVSTHVLERAGQVLGVTATMDHDLAPAVVTGLSLSCHSLDNSQIVIGENIVSFRTVFLNDSGAAVTVGENVLIFMRGGSRNV